MPLCIYYVQCPSGYRPPSPSETTTTTTTLVLITYIRIEYHYYIVCNTVIYSTWTSIYYRADLYAQTFTLGCKTKINAALCKLLYTQRVQIVLPTSQQQSPRGVVVKMPSSFCAVAVAPLFELFIYLFVVQTHTTGCKLMDPQINKKKKKKMVPFFVWCSFYLPDYN
jgi:hypothetical protein